MWRRLVVLVRVLVLVLVLALGLVLVHWVNGRRGQRLVPVPRVMRRQLVRWVPRVGVRRMPWAVAWVQARMPMLRTLDMPGLRGRGPLRVGVRHQLGLGVALRWRLWGRSEPLLWSRGGPWGGEAAVRDGRATRRGARVQRTLAVDPDRRVDVLVCRPGARRARLSPRAGERGGGMPVPPVVECRVRRGATEWRLPWQLGMRGAARTGVTLRGMPCSNSWLRGVARHKLRVLLLLARCVTAGKSALPGRPTVVLVRRTARRLMARLRAR